MIELIVREKKRRSAGCLGCEAHCGIDLANFDRNDWNSSSVSIMDGWILIVPILTRTHSLGWCNAILCVDVVSSVQQAAEYCLFGYVAGSVVRCFGNAVMMPTTTQCVIQHSAPAGRASSKQAWREEFLLRDTLRYGVVGWLVSFLRVPRRCSYVREASRLRTPALS